MKKIKLTQITDIQRRKTQDGTDYIRLTLLTGDNLKARVSMTELQLHDLLKLLKAEVSDDGQKIFIPNPFELNYDAEEKTKKGKLFVELREGEFETNKFKYYELSSALFIKNNLIRKTEVIKNFNEFFKYNGYYSNNN